MFNQLLHKLQTDKYLTLETTPMHEPSMETIIENIKKYNVLDKIDGFSATDNPLAKLKYNAIFAALKLQNEFNKPVIATMTMRDRNKIALQSDLIAANDFDVRAVLALTGDPAKMSDQPHVKGVFEGNSLMLLQMIKSFNNGMDFSGKPFKIAPQKIFPFAVTNSYSKSFKNLEKKMVKKIQDGAVGIISQPVYDIENAKVLIETFNNAVSQFNDERAKAQLIIGLFPITKLRSAQFLSSHVPGIHVPDKWIHELSIASKVSLEEEYKVGISMSKKLFDEVQNIHPKIHLMTGNKFDVAQELIG